MTGAHQMELPSPLISWVNPFPSRVINRTIFFVMRLNRMNAPAACCHFSIFIGSFLYQRAKPPQGIVLFINLLGKGLTPRACMGDAGSIWWGPDFDNWVLGPEKFTGLSRNWHQGPISRKCWKLCRPEKPEKPYVLKWIKIKVSCLETPSFWRYKENHVTRNAPERFRDF